MQDDDEEQEGAEYAPVVIPDVVFIGGGYPAGCRTGLLWASY